MEPPSANTVILTILAVATAIKAYYDHQDKKAAAVKVAEVKEILQTNTSATAEHETQVRAQLTEIRNTGDDTHKLVNNNMAIQLKVNALSARSLASAAPTKANKLLAEEAERLLASHMAKQATVDAAIAERQNATP
jgi:hypothetical protein